MSYRIIIAGGRDFKDYPLLEERCDHFLVTKVVFGIEVVSGCAHGADALGQQYSIIRGYELHPFPALWGTHGKAAGPIRNHVMGDYAAAGPDGGGLIAFWDGHSRGTKDMIEYARSIGLPVKVVNY